MASEAEIEAGALALHKRNGFAPWDRCNEAARQEYRADASAALEAAERVRAAEMAKLEKSLTSLSREDRPE